ncbi:MAG: hypothetical protein GXP22_07800 [Gammaproteobacteria bacterium]|nr:hypothetical protein [Gammaproteobacteria bacterium]
MLKHFFTLAVLIVVLSCNLSGCVEARFELSSESRLPKWFDIPEGMSRDELRVTVDYYIKSSGGEAVFKLYGDNGTRLKKVKGEMGIYPLQLKNPPEGSPENYPMYEIVIVDGVTDVIEHRERSNIFHMTNEPAILEEFGIRQ